MYYVEKLGGFECNLSNRKKKNVIMAGKLQYLGAIIEWTTNNITQISILKLGHPMDEKGFHFYASAPTCLVIF